ncbi:hypothetical protein AgCh_004677 [Apium graveolens]
MTPKDLIIDGAKFVPNNYAAILDNAEAPSELYFVQDLLAHSEIGYAMTQPSVFSSHQVLTLWRTGNFDNGGPNGTPSIVFEVGDSSYAVTPGTIRKALHLPEGCTFSIPEESALQELLVSLGYEQSLAKLGQLKRAHIRREWSFFFDCITKAFGNKCSNFDAIPIMSQHIGTSTPPFKVAKRYFNDLVHADTKKPVTVQPSSSEPLVKPSSSKPKRTKTVPQTPQMRRRIVLRDESDRKKRPISDDEEAATKEGDQESLISQEPESAKATDSPSTPSQEAVTEKANTPSVSHVQKSVSPVNTGTSADIDIQTLVVPEVLYLEAPTSTNPLTTPVTDAAQTPELSTTPSLHLDADDQNTGEHQDMAVDQNLEPDQKLEDVEASIATHTVVLSEDTDSVSSDATNAGDTGDAAPNTDADEAGPSGHAPQQTILKSELVKKFVTREAPVPWSETPAGQEWTKEWNSVSCVPIAKHLAEHLTKADEMFNSDDFKTQLRVTALSTKHLQGLHSTTHAELYKIQEEFIKHDQIQKIDKKKFFQPTFDRIAYIEKTQEKQQALIDDILKNQASQQSQLTEIQASVELLVSLLRPADAKKGERVIKSKYKTAKTLKGKDDEKDDQGNSGMGRGHSQGRGFSSRKAEITSYMTSSDTGKRISSATGKRISSDELLDLDEEMSRQLFLRENPGMDLESLMEEEARLKSERVTSKSEASGKKTLPKLKGIVIKERTNIEAILAKSQPQIDPRSKGKEKVGEPIKVYVPPENEEITDEKDDLTLTSRKVLKTTSDMTQVVQSQETTQPLKTAASGFEARVVTGKEARDKTGLGSADERRIQNTTNDPTSLSEPDIGATPTNDGRVYHIRQNAIPLKYFEELEHVLFLLQVDDRLTGSAANYLKDQIQRQKRLYSVKSDSTYVPKAVEFNLESDKAYLIRLDQDIRKAKINDLRAAIFQIGEDTAELKDAKRRMIDELRYAERCFQGQDGSSISNLSDWVKKVVNNDWLPDILDMEILSSKKGYEEMLKLTDVALQCNGWAEGECEGKAGWFPLSCIERREQVLASKVDLVF